MADFVATWVGKGKKMDVGTEHLHYKKSKQPGKGPEQVNRVYLDFDSFGGGDFCMYFVGRISSSLIPPTKGSTVAGD